jgi:hypothetical protein
MLVGSAEDLLSSVAAAMFQLLEACRVSAVHTWVAHNCWQLWRQEAILHAHIKPKSFIECSVGCLLI